MAASKRIVALLLLLLLVPGTLLAQSPEPEDSDGDALVALDEAILEFRRGGYDMATSLCAEALELDPNLREARVLLVRIDRAVGRYDAAIEKLAELIEAHPEQAALRTAHGALLHRTGQSEKAKEALLKALELAPDDFEANLEIGLLYDEVGEKEQAAGHLEKVLDLYAAAPEPTARDFIATGRACRALDLYPSVEKKYRSRMHDYAVRMYKQAYETDPRAPTLYANWGQLYLDKYDYPEAAKVFKRGLDENPKDADCWLGLARATMSNFYKGTKRYTEARKNLEKALHINENLVGAYVTWAQLLMTDGADAEALAKLDRGLSVCPTDLEARSTKAAIYLLNGKKEKLDAERKRVFAHNPNAAAFFWQVATLIEDRFRYHEAVDYCKKALIVDADFDPAYTTLGLNLLRTGDEKTGKEMLDEAMERDPYNVYTYNSLQVLDVIEEEFTYSETAHFVVRTHREEHDAIGPYMMELLERGHAELSERYDFVPEGPILFEAFKNMNHFSARSIGLPFIGASGVCFGKVITMVSARGFPRGAYNWGRTLWHEFAHVITVQKTKHRIPRWFTEGLSVYEETRARPDWAWESDRALLDAISHNRIQPIGELNAGFTKPRFPGQVQLSYYQAGRICHFIETTFGFDKILGLLDGYRDYRSTEELIPDVLGISLEEFDRRFLAYLKKTYASITYKSRYGRYHRRKYKELTRKEPKNATWWAELARAELHTGHRADAETALGRALKLDPSNGDAFLILAEVHRQRKELSLALENYKKALENETTDPLTAHIRLGLFKKKEDRAAAIRHFEAARDLFPRHGFVLRQLAELYSLTGNLEGAVDMREELVAFDSKTLPERMALIEYYEKEGMSDRLLALCEQLVYIDPYIPRAHELAGEQYLRRQRYDEAVREFQVAISLGVESPGQRHLDLAEAELRRGNLKRAGELITAHRSADPERADTLAAWLTKKKAGEPIPDPPPPENPEESEKSEDF